MTLIEWWVTGTVVSVPSDGGLQTLLWGVGTTRICEDLSKQVTLLDSG